MGLFDDLEKTMTDAGQKIKETTTELSEVAKLNAAILKEEANVKTLYYKLGEAYYKLHKDDCEETLNPYVTSIQKSKAKIQELNDELTNRKE